MVRDIPAAGPLSTVPHPATERQWPLALRVLSMTHRAFQKGCPAADGAAQVPWPLDRGAIFRQAPADREANGFISRYRLDMTAVFIADMRFQIGLRSEISLIGPI